MREYRTPDRTAVIATMFAQIYRSTPEEARSLSMLLSASDRADMALFCYGRTHTREQARAIATACSRDVMIKVGGQAGAALFDQAELKGDTWGAVVREGKRPVSLAR